MRSSFFTILFFCLICSCFSTEASKTSSSSSEGGRFCFGTFGGTHFRVIIPVIVEAIKRGHDVSIFLPSGHLDDAVKALPAELSFNRINTSSKHEPLFDLPTVSSFNSRVLLHPFSSSPAAVPDDVMGAMWTLPRRAEDFMLVPLILGVILPVLLNDVKVTGCSIVSVDPFQHYHADRATELGVPALSLLNPQTVWTPPPFTWFPLAYSSVVPAVVASSSLPPSSFSAVIEQAVYDVCLLGGRLLLTSALHIAGFVFYGTPRHLFATVFSRPMLSPIGQSDIYFPLPRSIIPLGPYRTVTTGQDSKSPISIGDDGQISIKLPCSKERPLIVRKNRLLYSAFGTNVKVPLANLQTICKAFNKLIDAGLADAGLIGRNPLDFNSRWTPQLPVLASGAVSVFLTHGGFSSLLEAREQNVPVVVLPVFADQPVNADLVTRKGAGLSVRKQDDANTIANQISRILESRSAFLTWSAASDSMDAFLSGLSTGSAESKAISLMELMIDGGVDNALQRLVHGDWYHYALPSAVRQREAAARFYYDQTLFVAIIWTVTPIFIIITIIWKIVSTAIYVMKALRSCFKPKRKTD